MIKLLLPDQSETHFDEKAFKFTVTPITEHYGVDYSEMYDVDKLVHNLQSPRNKFGHCFRRLNDEPRYSSILAHYNFDFTFLNEFYSLKIIQGYGGTFSSSSREVELLDGKLIMNEGYGWGSNSWTALVGFQVLRAVCLLFGIQQPRAIKGEKDRNSLSDILLDLNGYGIKHRAFSKLNCPWKIS